MNHYRSKASEDIPKSNYFLKERRANRETLSQSRAALHNEANRVGYSLPPPELYSAVAISTIAKFYPGNERGSRRKPSKAECVQVDA